MIPRRPTNIRLEAGPRFPVLALLRHDPEGERHHVLHLVEIGDVEHEREPAPSMNESQGGTHARGVDSRLHKAIEASIGNVEGEVRRVRCTERIAGYVIASRPPDARFLRL